MIRKVIFTLFIFLFTIHIYAQEKSAFEKVKFGSELYGYWISSASTDWANQESSNFKHTVYHFKKNDSLDIIVNGKISKSIPAEGYNINDTFYVAFYGQVRTREASIKRDLLAVSWNNDTLTVRKSDIRRYYENPNFIFYRSKSNSIPDKEYAGRLVGRAFVQGGWTSCGENFSSNGAYHFKFETDSSYTKTSITTTSRFKDNKNIVEREVKNIGTFSYKIEKDILLMESEEAIRAMMVIRPTKVRQLIGLTENRLIISNMREVKEEWIISIMKDLKEE